MLRQRVGGYIFFGGALTAKEPLDRVALSACRAVQLKKVGSELSWAAPALSRGGDES